MSLAAEFEIPLVVVPGALQLHLAGVAKEAALLDAPQRIDRERRCRGRRGDHVRASGLPHKLRRDPNLGSHLLDPAQ